MIDLIADVREPHLQMFCSWQFSPTHAVISRKFRVHLPLLIWEPKHII